MKKMSKTVEGGATSAGGKKIVGLYITKAFEDKIKKRADALSLSRGAYIILAINEKLERDALREQQTDIVTSEENEA